MITGDNLSDERILFVCVEGVATVRLGGASEVDEERGRFALARLLV